MWHFVTTMPPKKCINHSLDFLALALPDSLVLEALAFSDLFARGFRFGPPPSVFSAAPLPFTLGADLMFLKARQ